VDNNFELNDFLPRYLTLSRSSSKAKVKGHGRKVLLKWRCNLVWWLFLVADGISVAWYRSNWVWRGVNSGGHQKF